MKQQQQQPEALADLQKKFADEEKQHTLLKKNHTALQQILQIQVNKIKELSQQAGNSPTQSQEQSQVQQLTDELAARDGHLKAASDRIAELERALASAPAQAPTCGHNPEDFVEKWKYLRQRELAQKEIGKRLDRIKELEENTHKLNRVLLEKKAKVEECETRIDSLDDEVRDLQHTIGELEDDNEHLRCTISDQQGRIVEINDSFDLEKVKFQQDLTWYRQSTVSRGDFDRAINERDVVVTERDHLAEQINQHNCGEKDGKINELERQVAELKNSISQAEKYCQEKIQGYETQVQKYQAEILGHQTNLQQTCDLASTKFSELDGQIATLSAEVVSRHEKIVGLTTQLDKQKAENGRLQEQIRILGQAAQNRVQGELGNSTQFKQLYEHYHQQATALQEDVRQLHLKLEDYEAQARAHVCHPVAADTIVPAPALALPLSFSDIRVESTAPIDPSADPEYEAAYAVLIAAAEKWSCSDKEDVADAPATATEAININPSTSTLASSSSLLSTPPSFPPAAPHLSAPPSSPPSPPRQYDPREDVPDINSWWWFGEDHFKASRQPVTFEFRRTIPYCNNCRTRRALRLVDGEWKVPRDFHQKKACAGHYRPFDRFCRVEDCPDCIEADSPGPDPQDELPEELRVRHRCRGYACPPLHDEIQQRARWVLAEERRYQQEKAEAVQRHHDNLRKYREVYGRSWPASKVEQ